MIEEQATNEAATRAIMVTVERDLVDRRIRLIFQGIEPVEPEWQAGLFSTNNN